MYWLNFYYDLSNDNRAVAWFTAYAWVIISITGDTALLIHLTTTYNRPEGIFETLDSYGIPFPQHDAKAKLIAWRGY